MKSTNTKASEKLVLPFHERLAAWLIASTTIFLIIVNIANDSSELPTTTSEHAVAKQLIEISIQGAVDEPGAYQIKKGTTVGEAIALAKPLPEANLDRVKLDAPIQKTRKIIVPAKNKLPSKSTQSKKPRKKKLKGD